MLALRDPDGFGQTISLATVHSMPAPVYLSTTDRPTDVPPCIYRPTCLPTYQPILSIKAFCSYADLFSSMFKKIKDGRWAYTEIPYAMDGDPGLLEPDVYGKLRSPWNTNDRA